MAFPRMTVRRWMIAVAGIAFGCAASVGISRARSYEDSAGEHYWQAEICRKSAQDQGPGRIVVCVKGKCRWFDVLAADADAERSRMWIRAHYHERMGDKYEYAARHPWLPIPQGLAPSE